VFNDSYDNRTGAVFSGDDVEERVERVATARSRCHPAVIVHPSDEPTDDARIWHAGADRVAAASVEHAASHGLQLDLRPDTAVIPDARSVPEQHLRGTWGEIDRLFRWWTQSGCRWVNLRFSIDNEGVVEIRYEVQPEGAPLRPGRVTYANGGFDCARILSPEAFALAHPTGQPDPI
jgi:hypothetical protein